MDEHTPKSPVPGAVNNIRNQSPSAQEIVIQHPDGTKVHFNLAVGQTAKVIYGEQPVTILVYPANADLVGA